MNVGKVADTLSIIGFVGAIVTGLWGAVTASQVMILLAIVYIIGFGIWKFAIWRLITPNKKDERDFEIYEGFARFLQNELIDIDQSEAWGSDNQYIDLEVKIEPFNFFLKNNRKYLSGLLKRNSKVYKYKSLHDAWNKTPSPIILLEGEPGSGKSISLRQLAKRLLLNLFKERKITTLPLYINLRGLQRDPDMPIDRNLINDYIFNSLNHMRDPGVDAFLKSDFETGRRKGTWLFLLDSFDEIPEILSAKDADDIIDKYSKAISDFSLGINKCQVIVASRYYRGPTKTSWTKFIISPLSEKQKKEFIKNRDQKLSSDDQKILIGGLVAANDDIREMSSNPLFLELLCDYLQSNHNFPENIHNVFENYISARFQKDRERLKLKFDLSPEEIRGLAEKIGYCIAVDHELGLSSEREKLFASMQKHNLSCPPNFHGILDAMEILKLARADNPAEDCDRRRFAFSHRRIQEYFATCIILRETQLVSTNELLTNARLRETCVTVFQTQPADAIQPLIQEAVQIAQNYKAQIEKIYDISKLEDADKRGSDNDTQKQIPLSFEWPQGLLYFLGLLQDALRKRSDLKTNELYSLTGSILRYSFYSSQSFLLDQKWTMEVLGSSRLDGNFYQLLMAGLYHSKTWIKNVAYQQLANVWDPDGSYIEPFVRRMLLESALSGKFYQERESIYFFLSRFSNSNHHQQIHRQLEWVYRLDFSAFSLFGMLIFILGVIKVTNAPSGFDLVSIIIIFLISVSPLLAWITTKESRDYSLHSFWFSNDHEHERFNMPEPFTIRMVVGNTSIFICVLMIFVGVAFFVKQISDLTGLITFIFFPILWSYIVLLPSATFLLLFRTGKFSNPKYWFFAPFLLIHLDYISFKGKLSREGFFSWVRRRKILVWSLLIAFAIIIALHPSETLATIEKFIPAVGLAWRYISDLLASIAWPSIKLPPAIIKLANIILEVASTILVVTIIPVSFFAAVSITVFVVKGLRQWIYRFRLIPSENKRFSDLIERTTKLRAKEFLDSITYHNPKLSRAAAGHIFSNRLLDNDQETILALKFFIAYLQYSLENQDPNFNEVTSQTSPPQHVTEWQLFYQKNLSEGLTVFGEDMLELANRTLETLVDKK